MTISQLQVKHTKSSNGLFTVVALELGIQQSSNLSANSLGNVIDILRLDDGL
jgi:hypothetical protein